MKKLKLVVSDLHLGKGHILNDGSLNPFEEFYYDDRFREFLEHYSSGEFEDYEIELIINGDFLNLLQVDYRGHYLTALTEAVEVAKIKSVVEGHSKVFRALREFASKPNKRLTYIVGKHDQGILWPKARDYLEQVLETKINFKNLVYFFDGVHIEHGHQFEAVNKVNPRKFFLKQDYPEPILNLPWASHFFISFVMKIKAQMPYIDKVRPFSRLLKWSLINDFSFTIKTLGKLIAYFVGQLFNTEVARHGSIREIFSIIKESAIYPDLETAAKKILSDERVHTVCFGHSHVYTYRKWSNSKEYFNTGTWTEVTSLDIGSLGKITKLTYLLFEYPADQGRPRGRLKEWKGQYRIELDVAI